MEEELRHQEAEQQGAVGEGLSDTDENLLIEAALAQPSGVSVSDEGIFDQGRG